MEQAPAHRGGAVRPDPADSYSIEADFRRIAATHDAHLPLEKLK
ncbi:hypothetical protein SPMU_08720 [Sphingomonas mucosissima]|uniref:Uncharacterized protein n=1 Tax=Sphingomonas mucosissima TaxID=370959 RepID=A0A245ZS28_9SPHN|nr:hypothetical protein SPMU_08720 [Sphingomonas mucosissima]